MKVSSIESFDDSKQYIYATKQEDKWVLPKLSAKNLFDLDVATTSGFLTNNVKFENDKLVFSVSGDNQKDIQVEFPSDYTQHVISGSYNSETKKLVLTNNDKTTITIDLSSIQSDDSSISNKVIQFTSSNSDGVVWNDSVAVFTHNMNCVPIVTLYNSNMIQIMCDIQIIDSNTFSIDFQDASIVDGTWKMILSYGTTY